MPPAPLVPRLDPVVRRSPAADGAGPFNGTEGSLNLAANHDPARLRLECVQPDLGADLWRRDLPDCDPELAARLDRHVAVCDACRLERMVQATLAAGLAAEALRDARPALVPARRLPLAATGGWLALAASLALATLLPPGTLTGGPTRGGATGGGFVHPVEDEVVAGTPDLQWKAVPGATGYVVALDGVGGDHHATARTDANRLPAGKAFTLPAPGRYRAIVRTIPDDLTPPEGMSVTFRSGSRGQQFTYRIGAAPWPLRLLGLSGLLLGMSGVVRRRRRPAA